MICTIKNFALIVIATLTLSSCLDLSENTDFDLGDHTYGFAIPLINSKITVAKIAEESKGNTSIRIDNEGKTTVFYNGEVIRRNTASIFPPFPGLIPFPLPDTSVSITIFDVNKYQVKRGKFQGTKIKFSFETQIQEDVKVVVTIPQLSKDNKVFSQEFVIPNTNSSPNKFTTPEISVDGWELQTVNNVMTVKYNASTNSLQNIKLDFAQMSYDVIRFSILEGYLGYHEFKVDGKVIDVGLFNKWLSGSFDFTDPKITLAVENGFGLPVRSRVNEMKLTSITGSSLNLESEFINTGIDFSYPNFNEMGTTKTTFFEFNKENSNIRQIFNEKTKSISYDIEALVNPDKDQTINGYINDNGFFVVNVAVEVPLNGSINNVMITDTFEINLEEYDEVKSAEFKSLLTNDFPAEIEVQGVFLDQNNNPIDNLFEGNGIVLPPATLLPNEKTEPGLEKIDYIKFDKDRFDKLRKTKKLALIARLNTIDSDIIRPLWIFEDYGISFKLGAIIDYQKTK